MNRWTRILVATAAVGITAALGVLIGRALRGEPSPADAAAQPEVITTDGEELDTQALAGYLSRRYGDEGWSVHRAATAADVTPAPDRFVPVLTPVYVGGSDEMAEIMLDPPPVEAGAPNVQGASNGTPAPSHRGVTPIPIAGGGPVDADEPADTAETVPDSTAGPDEPAATPDGTGTAGTPSDATADGEPGPEERDAAGGAAGGPPSGATGGVPYYFDPLLGWSEWLRLALVDPCAGVEPGSTPAEGCPPGVGGTLLGLRMPPEPFMFFSWGHYLTAPAGSEETLPCPADTASPSGESQAAMTLFTRTPLESVSLRMRPYGSSEAWVDLPTLLSTPAADVSRWNALFEERDYDIGWGTTAICFLVDREPRVAYEIEGSGVDIFGRPVRSNTAGLVPIEDPDRRPPTTGTIARLGPYATVRARTVADGMVQMHSQIVDPADLDPADLACPRLPSTASGSPSIDRSAPMPPGVYDPAYVKRYSERFPIPVGGALHVCAWIYPTDNPLTPLAVDSLLFTAPPGQLPRIVLQGIRRAGFADERIASLWLSATVPSTTDHDPCSRTYSNAAEPLEPNRTYNLEHTLWECDGAPLPVAASGSVDVPIRLTRPIDGGEPIVQELAVRIDPDDCAAEPCQGRPREWYEIPIPSASRRLCGTVFGSGGCDPAPLAGIAVVRVDYPVVSGSTEGAGEVLLLDQVDVERVGDAPGFTRPTVTFRTRAGNPFVSDASVSIFADRPVRLGISAQAEGDVCYEGSPVPVTENFATEFTFEMDGFCAGAWYDLMISGVDEAGTTFEWRTGGLYSPPIVSNDLDVEVELLGGPRAELGYFYQFNVLVEGQSTTAYWFDFTSPRRGSAEACMALDGTRARSRGYHPPILLFPRDLTVSVTATITTTGNGDCSGDPRTGLGALSLEATFTREQLLSGEPLVAETPPEAPVQMRVTIDPRGTWRSR